MIDDRSKSERLNKLKDLLKNQSEEVKFENDIYTSITKEDVLEPIPDILGDITFVRKKIVRDKNISTVEFLKIYKQDILDEMIELRISALKSRHTITRYISKKYEISTSTCYTLIKDMEKLMEKFNSKRETSLESRISENIDRLEILQELALIKEDYKLVLSIAQELAKMQGFYIDHNKQLTESQIPTGFNIQIVKNEDDIND